MGLCVESGIFAVGKYTWRTPTWPVIFHTFQNMVACPRWNCTFGEEYLVYLSRAIWASKLTLSLIGLV